MLTANIQVNEFNRGLNRLITRVGLDSKRVMKTEVGQLIKTLVKVSPPKNLTTAKKKAAGDVRGVFRPIPKDTFETEKMGKRQHRWLYASPWVLVGVKADDHVLDIAANAAKRHLYPRKEKTPASMRLGRRGKQVVELINRKITKRNTFNQIVRKVQNNFGRLKAAWLVGVNKGEVSLTGGNKPPSWVTKHGLSPKGQTQNGLNTPNNPTYTIINRAPGVSKQEVVRAVNTAMSIRAKAMAANAKLIISGKKEYQYGS